MATAALILNQPRGSRHRIGYREVNIRLCSRNQPNRASDERRALRRSESYIHPRIDGHWSPENLHVMVWTYGRS